MREPGGEQALARSKQSEQNARLRLSHVLNITQQNARAGTRTRVQALATPGDNHYTTLAEQASHQRSLFD